MNVRDIQYIAGNYAVGNVMKIPQGSGESIQYIEAEIIGKYPFFALFREIKPETNYISKLCVQWKDFVRLGIKK